MTSKTIAQLAKEWKINRARLRLEALQLDDDADDALDRLTTEADRQGGAILDQILETQPMTGDDVLAVVDIVLGRLESDDFTPGEREVELLRHVRPWFWRLRQDSAAGCEGRAA